MSTPTVTFAYKTNPARFESCDAGVTLPVPNGVTLDVAMRAARAIVYTSLGMKTTKDDRVAAKRYLAVAFPGTELVGFKP